MPLELLPDVRAAIGLPPIQPPAPTPQPQFAASPPLDPGTVPAIPPIDAGLAGAPPPGGEQLAPPPVPVAPPPEQQAPTQQGVRPDYQISPDAFGKGATPPGGPSPAPQPAPARPLTPQDKLDRAENKRSAAEDVAYKGVEAKEKADLQQAADDQAAYKAFGEQAKHIQDDQKEFQDAATKTRAEKMAYVDKARQDATDYKVDRDQYMKKLGVGGKVRWGIAMIMAGVGQAMQRQGGPNPILGMLQDQIAQSINGQLDEKERLAQRAGAAQQTLDRHDAFSKDRMAQFHLRYGEALTQLDMKLKENAAQAKTPEAQANALKAAADVGKNAAESLQKSAEFAATNDIAKKNLAVSQGQLGVSQQNATETARHNRATEELTAQQRDLEALRLERTGKNDQAKLVRERAVGGEVTPIKDKDGKITGYNTGLITTKNGEVWVPNGTDPVVTDFQKGHEAAMRLLSTIDEMRRLGPEYLSDTRNSKKFQELKQQMADSRLEAIKYHGLGVPTGHDVELAEGSIGTSDPTRWKDSMDGLNKAREAIIKNQNITMRERGLDKEWSGPPDPLLAPKAEPSEAQRVQTVLKRPPDENPERARDIAYTSAIKSNGGDAAAARAAGAKAADLARGGEIDSDQVAAFDGLTKRAIEGDQEAVGTLQEVRKNGATDSIRAYAGAVLKNIEAGPAPVSGEYNNRRSPAAYSPQDLVNRFFRKPSPTIPSPPPSQQVGGFPFPVSQ